MKAWTVVPPQNGRVAVVTGTGGLGFEDALALARAGCDTILAGRNPDKGAEAIDRIRQQVPGARIRFSLLDLADLLSVAAFGERLARECDRIDILINNAAVMVPPERRVTADGFELQLGTNYLGHFALTAHLLPILQRSDSPRIVSLSSIAALRGAIDFNDFNAEERYVPMISYAQSKLACLMFAFELQRRSDAGGWGVTSIGAHPGLTRTNLIHNGAGPRSLPGRVRSLMPFLFQPAARGALPTLFAATAPAAQPGGYYGPDGFGGVRGDPAEARIPQRALDRGVAARLWKLSEELTGVRFGPRQPALRLPLSTAL